MNICTYLAAALLDAAQASQYKSSTDAVGWVMPRFTIDIDDQFNETLNKLANGGSKADVIRRAVASYQYLKSEVPANGPNRLSITDSNGVVKKDVVLP